jgi:hypothetical protein
MTDVTLTPWRWIQFVLGAGWLILVMSLSGCETKEAKPISMTGIVYNYAQTDYAWVKVNGGTAGTGLQGVESGGVSGGGGMCCVLVAHGASEADVLLEPAVGQSMVVKARIEKWWPDLAHYAVVHVLPGGKVVMQITPSFPSPRKDLLEAQQRSMGQPVQVKFQVWSAGPIERIDGKQ